MERHLPSPLVTVEEAARVLGTSTATIRRWASAGEIPVLRVGRRIRVDLSKMRGRDQDDIARLARDAKSP
jgi:excisionase family DNA binding protein